jgi:hypothetical protein
VSGFPGNSIESADLQKEHLDEYLRLTARAQPQQTWALQDTDNGTAFQTLQDSGQGNAQTTTHYPQGLLRDDHLSTDFFEGADQNDRFQSFVDGASLEHDSIMVPDADAAIAPMRMDGETGFDAHAGFLGSEDSLEPRVASPSLSSRIVNGQADSSELSALLLSSSPVLGAAESPLSLSRPSSETKSPGRSRILVSNEEHPDSYFDETVFRHHLPATGRYTREPNTGNQTRSAKLWKDLLSARSDKSASHKKLPSTWIADIHSFARENDRADSPLDLALINHDTFVDTNKPQRVNNAHHYAPESTCQDLSGFLQSQEDAAVAIHDMQYIERMHQHKKGWFRLLSKVVAYICKLPIEQREGATIQYLKFLGLSQPSQHVAAFRHFVRMVERNKETTNEPPPIVFRQWLWTCVSDVQKGEKAAKNSAENVKPVEGKAPFCNEGVHKLKCGHECRSNQTCGMNCLTYSAYSGAPFIDVRMAEIRCNQCGAW